MFSISATDIINFLSTLWKISKMAVFIMILILWMVSSSAFFSPVILKHLNILDVVNKYRSTLSIACILTGLILIFSIAFILDSRHKNRQRQKQLKQQIEEIINSLTPDELIYLGKFFFPKKKEIVCFNSEDLSIVNLIEKGILTYVYASSIFFPGGMPLKISVEFKPYITQYVMKIQKSTKA